LYRLILPVQAILAVFGPVMARKRKFFHAAGQSGKRSQVEAAEIEQLEQILESGKPAPNTDVLAQSNERRSGSYVGAKKFDELPISQNTKDGLAQSKFTQLTAIQRASLPHALCGRDILGAAKTGSGKTLAFLIPVSRPVVFPTPCRMQASASFPAFKQHELLITC